jgi:glycosyltransferase involved in cell wall biosynthesis
MKICLFTNHFYPEDFKANDVAFELVRKGYDVTVITAVPDYPKGVFFEGYGLVKKSHEIVNGCKVYRLPIIPRGNGNAKQLVMNYMSYFISASIFTFFHKIFFKYDAIFVHLTSPFFIGKCAVQMKKWQKIPLIFWTLDLWPESLTAAAGINNRFVLEPQIRMVRKVYTNCDRILIGSKGFEKSICEKGDFKNKLVYFPNWAESLNSLKSLSQFETIEPFSLFSKDDFIILFAGNIGESQDLDCVLDAANELKMQSKIKFVFLGDGRAKNHLLKKQSDLGLDETVFFPGRFPIDSMPYFMDKAHVLLVSLRNELIFNVTVPSKLQFYMAQGKPVLGMLNGDGANLIRESHCGIAVPSSSKENLVQAIEKMVAMPRDELTSLGNNGKKFYEINFRKELRINQLNDIFESLTECNTKCNTIK